MWDTNVTPCGISVVFLNIRAHISEQQCTHKRISANRALQCTCERIHTNDSPLSPEASNFRYISGQQWAYTFHFYCMVPPVQNTARFSVYMLFDFVPETNCLHKIKRVVQRRDSFVIHNRHLSRWITMLAILQFKYAILQIKHSILQFKHPILQFKYAVLQFKHPILRIKHAILCFKHAILQFKYAVLQFKQSNIQSFASNIQSFESKIQSFNSNMQSFHSNIESFY